MPYRSKVKRKLLSIHKWKKSHDRPSMMINGFNTVKLTFEDSWIEVSTPKIIEVTYQYSGKKFILSGIVYPN